MLQILVQIYLKNYNLLENFDNASRPTQNFQENMQTLIIF